MEQAVSRYTAQGFQIHPVHATPMPLEHQQDWEDAAEVDAWCAEQMAQVLGG